MGLWRLVGDGNEPHVLPLARTRDPREARVGGLARAGRVASCYELSPKPQGWKLAVPLLRLRKDFF